jgi:hypothetical protein
VGFFILFYSSGQIQWFNISWTIRDWGLACVKSIKRFSQSLSMTITRINMSHYGLAPSIRVQYWTLNTRIHLIIAKWSYPSSSSLPLSASRRRRPSACRIRDCGVWRTPVPFWDHRAPNRGLCVGFPPFLRLLLFHIPCEMTFLQIPHRPTVGKRVRTYHDPNLNRDVEVIQLRILGTVVDIYFVSQTFQYIQLMIQF